MNILLTGHLGYVGSVLAPRLLDRGHRVTGFDAGWFSRCSLYQNRSPVRRTLDKDIRDARRSDLEDIDVVVHLAGLSNDLLGRLNPDLTDEINHRAAVRLASLAKAAGVRRFVAASSCSVYGAAGDVWIDEDSTPAPVTEYARSKLAMEQGVCALADDGFEVVIARPGTVYGESPMLRFDLVLNNLLAWGIASNRIRFRSDGSAWRPLLHVDDLSRAFVFLTEAPPDLVAGTAINIGFNEQNFQVSELGPMIQSVLDNAAIETVHGDTDSRSYRVDCSRLQRIWVPEPDRQSMHEAIQRMAACLRQHPASVEDFEGPKYQRLAHLEYAMSRGWLDQELRVTAASSRYA